MEEYISFETLIERAKEKGVDFGKGDPYNRLRYYTKIGWLPHMVRRKDARGDTIGHYEISAVERLLLIEDFKSKGLTNDEISKKLQVKTRIHALIENLTSKEVRNQVITYVSLALLLLILGSELGVIGIGKSKAVITEPVKNVAVDTPKQVIDSGTAFIPKGQKKLFIQTPLIKNNYKVYITFTQEYSPAARFWIANIKDYDGFLVELDTPVFSNSEFNWWVTN